jgi:transposase
MSYPEASRFPELSGSRALRSLRGRPRRQDAQPVIADLYGRLAARGKKPKVALIASVRKLVTMLNAIRRHQRPWSTPPFPGPVERA